MLSGVASPSACSPAHARARPPPRARGHRHRVAASASDPSPAPGSPRAMILLGLTGSVAMGKSFVARVASEMGVPVLDSDAVVHERAGC